MKGLIVSLFLLLPGLSVFAAERIVSLAPHTTELVYSLQAGEQLVAVSEFSDYPEAAKTQPQVASYQGVNFEALMRLKPDLILAWQGGNKPQDIERLQSLGFEVFLSSPQRPEDIASELKALGKRLGKSELAAQLADDYLQKLQKLRDTYAQQTEVKVFYYMWPTPMMSIGPHAWASQMLTICNAQNLFADALSDYPEVAMEGVLARKPTQIVAAFEQPRSQLLAFWQPWKTVLAISDEAIHSVNPDTLHRFSLRLPDGISELCGKLHTP